MKVLKWGAIGVGVFVLWICTIFSSYAVVKDRVPVNLSTAGVSPFGDSYVVAEGTWVIDGDKQAFPLQTTKIKCEKALNRCTMSTATVMSGTLRLNLDDFEVVSWDNSRIVFSDDAPECVSYVFAIDLATKTTRAVRRKKIETSNAERCNAASGELRMSLKDGYKVAYELEQEAIPWFGRLAQLPLKVLLNQAF